VRELNIERKQSYLRYGEDIAWINDLFSASWIMNLSRFKNINTDTIATIEDGCFQPFLQYINDVRMTRDWLEFTVEHMSKWWKAINIFEHKQTLDAFIATLERFGHEPAANTVGVNLSNTIAIVPFMAYRSRANTGQGQGQALTVSMLKACLRSMSRYGMGRVVVVVPTVGDRDTYERLVPAMFGDTTVVFRVVTQVKTRFISINMPYGAIVGLQRAFESDDDNWLGNETRWDSVYLTEPDTLLHVKPAVLPELMNGVLNHGWVLTPHRLQPIPHATDLPFPLPPVVVVPNNEYHQVQAIDSYTTCCWDSGDDRPPSENVGDFWYMCGFRSGDHSCLRPYNMIRLSHGLGITMLMGSEHGRKCHIAPMGAT
jgi:hypothetical protein